MEKKRKLGRSLDEVADYWLSSSPLTHEHSKDVEGNALPETATKGFQNKTISVFYPESSKVKGLILSNITIELAKQGYSSCVLDYLSNDSPIKPIVNNLFESFSKTEENGDSSASHRILKLYGMPEIHFFTRPEENLGDESIPKKDDDMHSQLITHHLEGSITFLSHPDHLEMLSMMEFIPPVVILVSRPRRESLLISYAYIKSILKKDPHTQILMIMDEVTDRDMAIKAFTLLNQIVVHRLSHVHHAPKFLGSIIHDQALGISLATHYPLVLSEQHSIARDNIIRITSNFRKALENFE